MMKSHVIEVDGIFLGAAVQHATGYKFVPVMPQLIRLNGMVSPHCRIRGASRYTLCAP